MISQGRILNKSHTTVAAQIGSLSRVLPKMDPKCFWQGKTLFAKIALIRFFTSMSSGMFLQCPLCWICFLTRFTSKFLHWSMSSGVHHQIIFDGETGWANTVIWVVKLSGEGYRITYYCLFQSFCYFLMNMFIFAVFPEAVNLLCQLPCGGGRFRDPGLDPFYRIDLPWFP